MVLLGPIWTISTSKPGSGGIQIKKAAIIEYRNPHFFLKYANTTNGIKIQNIKVNDLARPKLEFSPPNKATIA